MFFRNLDKNVKVDVLKDALFATRECVEALKVGHKFISFNGINSTKINKISNSPYNLTYIPQEKLSHFEIKGPVSNKILSMHATSIKVLKNEFKVGNYPTDNIVKLETGQYAIVPKFLWQNTKLSVLEKHEMVRLFCKHSIFEDNLDENGFIVNKATCIWPEGILIDKEAKLMYNTSNPLQLVPSNFYENFKIITKYIDFTITDSNFKANYILKYNNEDNTYEAIEIDKAYDKAYDMEKGKVLLDFVTSKVNFNDSVLDTTDVDSTFFVPSFLKLALFIKLHNLQNTEARHKALDSFSKKRDFKEFKSNILKLEKEASDNNSKIFEYSKGELNKEMLSAISNDIKKVKNPILKYEKNVKPVPIDKISKNEYLKYEKFNSEELDNQDGDSPLNTEFDNKSDTYLSWSDDIDD